MTNPELQNMTILVVENNEKNWHLLRNIIEMWNGKALWAKTGIQAIETVKTNQKIRLVLIDLNMPFMSGIEAARRIKSSRPDIQMIALASFAEPELLNSSLEAGCSSYLIKPVDMNKLKQVFHRETAILKAL